MSGQGQRFGRQQRLRRAEEFRTLLRRGLRSDGPLFLLIVRSATRGASRVGLVVGAKLGIAVRRNTAKRRLRECFRRAQPAVPLDILLIPKREMLDATQRQLEREYERRLTELARRVSRSEPAVRRD